MEDATVAGVVHSRRERRGDEFAWVRVDGGEITVPRGRIDVVEGHAADDSDADEESHPTPLF
jgi:hypothetical protein